MMNVVKSYDDDTKIFLNTVLRDIPYLRDCSDEIINAIAMSMKQDMLEPGATYFKEGDP